MEVVYNSHLKWKYCTFPPSDYRRGARAGPVHRPAPHDAQGATAALQEPQADLDVGQRQHAVVPAVFRRQAPRNSGE